MVYALLAACTALIATLVMWRNAVKKNVAIESEIIADLEAELAYERSILVEVVGKKNEELEVLEEKLIDLRTTKQLASDLSGMFAGPGRTRKAPK